MSVVYFYYGDEDVTNTEVQEATAYYTRDGTVDWDSMYNDWLSGEGSYDSAILGYAWMSVNGIPDWVYAPEATFLEENPGTTDEGTLEALNYYAGSTTAVDYYLAFVESSGLADTSDLGGEIEDLLSQFEDDDTVVDVDDDDDGKVSGTFGEVFSEIAPSLIALGHAGLVLVLFGGIIFQEAVNDFVETGTDIYEDLFSELEDKIDAVEDVDVDAITAQSELQVLSSEINIMSTKTTTLADILQTVIEMPNIIVQGGFSSEKEGLDTTSFIAQTS